MFVVRQSTYDKAVADLSEARRTLESLGAGDLLEIQSRVRAAESRVEELRALAASEQARIGELQAQVVVLDDAVLLQEVGIYRFQHPLETSVKYKVELAELDAKIKDMIRQDNAVHCPINWTVNNSAAQGRKLVKEMSRLLLAAYNAEVENVIRTLRPHRRDAAIERVGKLRERIARNAQAMSITITPEFHQLRIEEITTTADYLQKVEDEKEEMRAERERLREAQKAQREFEAEQARLEREADKYRSALAKIEASGGTEDIETLRKNIEEIERAIAGLLDRAANIRAGYVYVISNVGSFGEDVVKIGLTRRLDPEERIRELSDASVPFNFDKHAIIFSKDAVGLETRLHAHFGDRRMNMVNLRREFFRATPQQVLAAIESFGDEVLTEFQEIADAAEWRQTQGIKGAPLVEGEIALGTS